MVDNPFAPQKGDKRIFFLTPDNLNAPTVYFIEDLHFGVQAASMAHELKRLAEIMLKEEATKGRR